MRNGGGGKEVVGSSGAWIRRGWKAVVLVSELENKKKNKEKRKKGRKSSFAKPRLVKSKQKQKASRLLLLILAAYLFPCVSGDGH